jgi:hypothetical protein
MEPNNVYHLNMRDQLGLIKKHLNELGLSFKLDPTKPEIIVKECPYCSGDLSKSDNQDKLYLNYEKFIYYCHRCNKSGTYYQFKKDHNLLGDNTSYSKIAVANDRHSKHEEVWIKGIALDPIADNAVIKYLNKRGVGFIESDLLRFVPESSYYNKDKKFVGKYPSLVSRISNNAGDFIGLHQIYLDEDGNKAPVDSPKKIHGKWGGGHILFGHPAKKIAVTEGVETAISIFKGTNLPTFSCICAIGLKNFIPPVGVREIHIFADNDKRYKGQSVAFSLATELTKKGYKVYVHIPNRLEFNWTEDKSLDFLDIYNIDKEYLKKAVDSAQLFEPDKDNWIPPMREEAFYGIVGRFINRIFDATEADKNALCVQFLIFFASMIGRIPYFQMSSDQHFPNLFAIIVGDTSSGRKGTGLSNCKAFFKLFCAEFVKSNISDGLATGEGLIHRLRDPIEEEIEESARDKSSSSEQKPAKKKIVDKGCTDKRMLVSEQEFVQVLNSSNRPGSILSSIIRKTWDGVDMSNLSKTAPQTVSNPYVCMIGQITPEELKGTFKTLDYSNGFGNRFLWVLSRRSKLLPIPPDISRYNFCDLIHDTREALFHSQRVGPMHFSDEALPIWSENYIKNQTSGKGILGAMTSRSSANILRISVVYALLDKSSVIEKHHLNAALAVWEYSYNSTAFLFGDATSPLSRKILYHLSNSEHGLSKTEIREIFSNHKSAEDIDSALKILQDDELVDFEIEPTKGRPIERWFAV